MHFHRFIGSAILTIALAAPASVVAAPRPQEIKARIDVQPKRVYDSQHKDYHNWDSNEDQQWRQYQSTEHLKYHDYSKAKKKDQGNYWDWRHQQDHDNHDNHHDDHDRR